MRDYPRFEGFNGLVGEAEAQKQFVTHQVEMGKECSSQQDSVYKAQTQETVTCSGKREFPMAGRESRQKGDLEDTVKWKVGSRSRKGVGKLS